MINTPSGNPVLSESEQNRINFLENRLLGFQKDITEAKKSFQEITVELEKITKEKEYQTGLLSEINTEITKAREELDSATNGASTARQERDGHITHSSNLKKIHEDKEAELTARENKLAEDQEMYRKNVNSLSLDRANLLKERDAVKAIRTLLSELVKKANELE